MTNTRPLPPADINPWARSIEKDVDGVLRSTEKISSDASTALQTANAAIAGLSRATEVTDWNDALLPGFYWAQGNVPNSPPNSGAATEGIVTVGMNGTQPRIIQEVKAAWSDPRIMETYRRRFDGSVWSDWYVDGLMPVRVRSEGAVSVPSGSTVTAYTYTPSIALRPRVAIINAVWHVGSTVTGASIDLVIKVAGDDVSVDRLFPGTPRTMQASATTVISEGAAPTISLQVQNGSGISVSSTTDSRFWHMDVALV